MQRKLYNKTSHLITQFHSLRPIIGDRSEVQVAEISRMFGRVLWITVRCLKNTFFKALAELFNDSYFSVLTEIIRIFMCSSK